MNPMTDMPTALGRRPRTCLLGLKKTDLIHPGTAWGPASRGFCSLGVGHVHAAVFVRSQGTHTPTPGLALLSTSVHWRCSEMNLGPPGSQEFCARLWRDSLQCPPPDPHQLGRQGLLSGPSSQVFHTAERTCAGSSVSVDGPMPTPWGLAMEPTPHRFCYGT